MRERPSVPLRLAVPLTRDDERPAPVRIVQAALGLGSTQSEREKLLDQIHLVGRYAFRHRSIYDAASGRNPIRERIRHVLGLLGACWAAEARGDSLRAWRLLENARAAEQGLVYLTFDLDRHGEQVRRTSIRRAKAIRGAELPRDWQARIETAIRENPAASNRKLAVLIGCDEATVRRWRKRG